MHRANRRLQTECNRLKLAVVVMAIAIAIMALFMARLSDDRDYYMHESYALRNGCEWQWDELGDWTTCK